MGSLLAKMLKEWRKTTRMEDFWVKRIFGRGWQGPKEGRNERTGGLHGTAG
jgi:hypothetical protein